MRNPTRSGPLYFGLRSPQLLCASWRLARLLASHPPQVPMRSTGLAVGLVLRLATWRIASRVSAVRRAHNLFRRRSDSRVTMIRVILSFVQHEA